MTGKIIYYQKNDVTITEQEAVFGEKAYRISEITSVRVGNKSFILGASIILVGLLWLILSLRWVAGIGETNSYEYSSSLGSYFSTLNLSSLADVFTFLWEIVISPLIGMYLIGYGITRIWIAKETYVIRMAHSSGVEINQEFYNSDEVENVVNALRRAITQHKE